MTGSANSPMTRPPGLSGLILNCCAILAVVICLSIIIWRKRGMIRIVFTFKAIASIVAMAFTITPRVIVVLLHYKVMRAFSRLYGSNFVKHIFLVLQRSFSQWDQACSVAFLHEMYTLTCVLELKKNAIKGMVIKIITAFLSLSLTNCLPLISPRLFIVSRWFGFLSVMRIFEGVFTTLVMIAALFWGINVVIALIKSNVFRSQLSNGSAKKAGLFPVLMVATIIFVQCLKWCLLVVQGIQKALNVGALKNCFTLIHFKKNFLTCTKRFASLHGKVDVLQSSGWLTILEIACVAIFAFFSGV